ncbi:MAG: hydro protein [Thermodesulfobacteriota bacterium]|nr:hydro protein [Thermodesulfobacteriota bacterium]
MLLIQFSIDGALPCVYRSEFQENLVQLIRLARERFHPIVLLATSHTFAAPYESDQSSCHCMHSRIGEGYFHQNVSINFATVMYCSGLKLSCFPM